MRGVLAAAAVVGALAIGGLPALALTTAHGDRPAASAADILGGDAGHGSGPPPWARAHGHEKHADKLVRKAEKRAQKAEEADGADDRTDPDDRAGGARPRGPRAVPPGWAKHHDKVRGHRGGAAVRSWAHCLAREARDLAEGERLDPVEACGPPPVPRSR